MARCLPILEGLTRASPRGPFFEDRRPPLRAGGRRPRILVGLAREPQRAAKNVGRPSSRNSWTSWNSCRRVFSLITGVGAFPDSEKRFEGNVGRPPESARGRVV